MSDDPVPGSPDTTANAATVAARSAPRRTGQRQRWWWWALMLVLVVGVVVVSTNTTPTTGTSDQRLFAIAARLKCLQCVGESVANSQAPLAVQFRDEIRTQMRSGQTDDEILNFFADRYGQQVLLTPPSSGLGALVWVIPVVALAAAIVALTLTFRRWGRASGSRHATEEDTRRVSEALNDPDRRSA